jgi:hypothetical protein
MTTSITNQIQFVKVESQSTTAAEPTSNPILTILCLSFFPLLYFVGNALMNGF